jgi:transposase
MIEHQRYHIPVHDGALAPATVWVSHYEARTTYSKFHPRYVMADKGYSTKALFWLIHRQYRARPIIDIPKSQHNVSARWAPDGHTPQYQALRKQRQAVERAFSRLKTQRSLNHITVRRKRKVTLHCYLALIAM